MMGGPQPPNELVVAALGGVAEDMTAAARRNLAAARMLAAIYDRDLARAQAALDAALAGRVPDLPVTVEPRLVVQQGIWLVRVWIPYDMLADLACGDLVDTTAEQERVLLDLGLAARHRGDGTLIAGPELAGYIARLDFADPHLGDLQ